MKTLKKTLSLTLVFALVFSLMSMAFAAETTTTSTTTTGYKDAADITYKEAVDVTSAIGVFQGNDLGAFAPKDNLTREQAAKIICYLSMGQAAADKLSTSSAPFADVAADRWSAGSIAYCVQQGIVAGYGNGNFGPNDSVTGYQFAKMLLVALGYDPSIEGFTGNDWQINVAKRAFASNLTEGNDAFVGTAAATREEAALYTENTLLAPTVTYATKGTEIKLADGSTIRQGASAPEAGASFMKTYYPSLLVNNDSAVKGETRADVLGKGTDDFGRSANIWTLKGKEIGTYPAGAVVSYTSDMTGTSGKAAVAKALKGYTISSVDVYVNGSNGAGTTVSSTDAIAALTGNGTRVDVYAANNAVTKVVVVKEVLAKVTYVNSTAETVSLLTQVDGNYGTSAVSLTTSLGYGKVAAGDYVVIATKDDSTHDGAIANDTVVADLTTVTTVTGKATTKSNTDATITVNGKTYDEGASVVTANNVASFAVSSAGDATILLDQYGYIVLAKSGTAVNADNLFVLTKVYSTMTNNQIVKMAQGYNSKGEQVDMALASDDVSGITNTATDAGKVYQYVLSTTDSGAYKLTALSSTWTTSNAYAPDSASNTATPYAFRLASQTTTSTQKTIAVTYNTSSTKTYYFASDVKTIFADSTHQKASVVSGAQTVSTPENMTYVLRSTGTSYEVSAVIVEGSATSSANNASDLVFLAAVDTNSVVGTNGLTYNSYTAVQNGAPIANCYGTQAPTVGAFYTVSKDSATGVYTFTAYTNATPLYTQSMTTVLDTNSAGTVVSTAAGTTLDISKATIINLDTKSVGSAAEIAAALAAQQAGATTKAPRIAAIYDSTTYAASVVYYTAGKTVTIAAPTATAGTVAGVALAADGIAANKTVAAKGDTITYTITTTGSASDAATVTFTAPAGTVVMGGAKGTGGGTLTATAMTTTATIVYANTDTTGTYTITVAVASDAANIGAATVAIA